MRPGLFVLSLLMLMTMASSLARAQDDDTEAARIHYKAGEQYYLRGHYSQAIGEFKEAYRLSKASALLFNISQAYERNGDLQSARDYLKRYIDSGDTEPGELPALKEKLASLDKRIASGKPEPKTEPKVVPPPKVVKSPPVPPPAEPKPVPVVEASASRPFKTWKWVTMGTGAGCLVLAGLFALDGQKQEQTLEDAVMPGSPVPYEYDDVYQRGKRANSLAVAFGVGGLALAATGVVFFVLDGKDKEKAAPQAQLLPLVAPGLAGASAVWRF